jgi:hypothetical protein
MGIDSLRKSAGQAMGKKHVADFDYRWLKMADFLHWLDGVHSAQSMGITMSRVNGGLG